MSQRYTTRDDHHVYVNAAPPSKAQTFPRELLAVAPQDKWEGPGLWRTRTNCETWDVGKLALRPGWWVSVVADPDRWIDVQGPDLAKLVAICRLALVVLEVDHGA